MKEGFVDQIAVKTWYDNMTDTYPHSFYRQDCWFKLRVYINKMLSQHSLNLL